MEDGNYDRGELRLGAEPAVFEDIPGIYVRGTVSEMKLLDWWDFFSDLYGDEAVVQDDPVSTVTVDAITPVEPVEKAEDLPTDASEVAETEGSAKTDPAETGALDSGVTVPAVSEELTLVSRLKEIEITVDNFILGEQRLENLNLQMQQIEQDWWAHLENETLKGRVRFFADASKPAIIELEYLRFAIPSPSHWRPI